MIFPFFGKQQFTWNINRWKSKQKYSPSMSSSLGDGLMNEVWSSFSQTDRKIDDSFDFCNFVDFSSSGSIVFHLDFMNPPLVADISGPFKLASLGGELLLPSKKFDFLGDWISSIEEPSRASPSISSESWFYLKNQVFSA